MTFYDRLSELCQQAGTSPSRVAQELGLSNSAATYWKKGSVPKYDTIRKIANRFNVTTDYLLGVPPRPNGRIKIGNKSDLEASGETVEWFAVEDFITSLGYETFIDITRYENPKGKKGDVWIVNDTRSGKYFTATTESLTRLAESILDYAKYQVHVWMGLLTEIDESEIGNYPGPVIDGLRKHYNAIKAKMLQESIKSDAPAEQTKSPPQAEAQDGEE